MAKEHRHAVDEGVGGGGAGVGGEGEQWGELEQREVGRKRKQLAQGGDEGGDGALRGALRADEYGGDAGAQQLVEVAALAQDGRERHAQRRRQPHAVDGRAAQRALRALQLWRARGA